MSNGIAHAEGASPMHGHDHAHHPALQHHFSTMAQQREAGVLGMWVFLLTEVLFFGGLFIVYTLYRMWYYEAFAAASKSIDDHSRGLINTVVLIGSSLTMALVGARGADQPAQGHGELAARHHRARHGVPRHQGLSNTPTSSSTTTCRARASSWLRHEGAAGGRRTRRTRRRRRPRPVHDGPRRDCSAPRSSSSASTSR